MKDWCSRMVRAWGSGVTSRTNSPLVGPSVVKVRTASTSVFFGNALVSSSAIVEREASTLYAPCLVLVSAVGNFVGVVQEKIGAINQGRALGYFGFDFEAPQYGLGERLRDGETLVGVGGRRAKRILGATISTLGPLRSKRTSGPVRAGRDRGRGRWNLCHRGGSGCRGCRVSESRLGISR